MRLSEIKSNKEITSKLRWDLTPQTASVSSDGSYAINNQADMDRLTKLLAEKAGYYFYVDVWNCQARLALMYNNAEGGGRSEIITDFDSPLLAKAVEEAGGWINQSGHYQLSDRLTKLLKKKLGQEA
jgi:hypothetical protein